MAEKTNRPARKKGGLHRLPIGFICICVLPTLLLTITFTIIPTARALWMSLWDSTALSLNPDFVWVENYVYMFRDEYFLQALANTAKLLAVVPIITIIFALVLAFMLSPDKAAGAGAVPHRLLLPQHHLDDGGGHYLVVRVPSHHGHREHFP